MFSQTTGSRVFSQEGEISQLTSPFISGKTSTQNDESNTQREVNEAARSYNEYDALADSQIEISQITSPFASGKTVNQNDERDTHEEINEAAHSYNENDAVADSQEDHQPLSSRADAICQQNRQLRGYLENNLKQIEKKRLKMSNNKREIEEKINILHDRYKCECQHSIDLQMSLEEVSENYQMELNGRKNHKEKLDHIQIVLDYFDNHYSEITRVVNDFINDKEGLKLELERLYIDLKAKVDEKNKLKLLCHAEMNEKTRIAKETAESFRKERETSLREVTDLFGKRSMNLNKQNYLEEKISSLLNNRKEMNESYIDLVEQKKLMKENFVRLLRQMDELNTTTSSAIQNLKLRIMNEQNNNSNLHVKCEEIDKCTNITSTKKKELINLYNQVSGAVEETTKKQEDKQKKVNEYKDNKSIISNEITELKKEMNEYERCEQVNDLLKSEVKGLEESNTAKEIILQEKQNSIDKISQEEEQLKKVSDDILFEIQNLNTQLQISIAQENDLTTKLKKEKIINQTERDAKMLTNKSLEKLYFECDSKLNELTSDLDEAKNSNNNVKRDKMKMLTLIEEYYGRRLEADEKLKTVEFEIEEKFKNFENNMDLKNKTLNEIENLVIDARPYQEELLKLLSRKEALNQDIQQQKENHYKEMKTLERSFSFKIKEISTEKEKFASIMESIIKEKVDTTEKLKQKINTTDAVRMSLETDSKKLSQQITHLKYEEQMKRNHVARLEKRLKTIQKEITVTREDLSDALTGNVKNQVKEKKLPELIKPSTKRIFQNVHQEPPEKKVAMAPNPYNNKIMSQTKTKQWIEATFSQDDFEFSDV